MRNLISALVILFLSACDMPPERDNNTQALKTNNPSMRVTLLGEVDGCKIYYVDPPYPAFQKFTFVKCKNDFKFTQTCQKISTGKISHTECTDAVRP